MVSHIGLLAEERTAPLSVAVDGGLQGSAVRVRGVSGSGRMRATNAARSPSSRLQTKTRAVTLHDAGIRYRCSIAADLRASRAVLWCVSNEPQLAHDAWRPPAAPIAPVHYPAAEIERQLAVIAAAGTNATTSGLALIFSSDGLEAARNILPTLTLSLNTLPPGTHQRVHHHNSAAVTLAVAGESCFSAVDGARCDWTPWATLVTPPGAPHSHHNEGGSRACFLIVQDGGLNYHARTMGFAFLE